MFNPVVAIDNDRQTMVLDASVLIGAGIAPFNRYTQTDFVVTPAVLREIDENLDDPKKGRACQAVKRFFDTIDENDRYGGAIELDNGNTIRFLSSNQASNHFDRLSSTASVLAVADQLQHQNPDAQVIVVSTNRATREEARSRELHAVPYAEDKFAPFSGVLTVELTDVTLSTLADINQLAGGPSADHLLRHHHNLYIRITDDVRRQAARLGNGQVPAHALVQLNLADGTQLGYLWNGNALTDLWDDTACGISARPGNLRQQAALCYLMDYQIEAVTLGGIAGSGKSLLALAAGLAQTKPANATDGGVGYHDRPYDQIIVFRSIYEVDGQKIGYLPGDLDDKMEQWSKAVWDNIAEIDRRNNHRRKTKVRRNGRSTAGKQPSDDETQRQPTLQERYANVSVEPVHPRSDAQQHLRHRR